MGKTIVIAHRGFTRDFPDNTLESFRAACEIGVDGVEFDVQEAADGAFVVYHDDSIDGKEISRLTAEEISLLRVGGRYAVPTLQQALEVLGRGLVLLVELKQVRSLVAFLSLLRGQLDPSFMVLVSFDAGLVGRLAVLAPDFTCAVIGDPAAEGGNLPLHETAGIAQVRCDDVRAEMVSRAHDGGQLVFAWDNGSEDDLRKALRCGVDIVMTDRPDIAIREVSRL